MVSGAVQNDDDVTAKFAGFDVNIAHISLVAQNSHCIVRVTDITSAQVDARRVIGLWLWQALRRRV